MSRHRNFRGSQKPPPPAAVQRDHLQRAALDELLRHGGNSGDAENLKAHFKEAAEPGNQPDSEIPEEPLCLTPHATIATLRRSSRW
jgi:hypothetical protein